MTICFFGYPNQNYSRYQILIDGLKKNGVKTIYCTDKTGLAPIRYWKLLKRFWKIHGKCDAILVSFPGHLNMPAAWLAGKIFNKLIVFDAFVSLFDTYIFDREIAPPESLKAKFYWWVDKIACTLADITTIDTYAHIKYFIKTFKLNRDKFSRIPVGGDNTLFKPRTRHTSRSKVIIEFHGMFTKIHGAEIFVRAAKELENHPQLEFWLIGSSQNYRLPIDLYKKLKPKNMKYWPRMQIKRLAKTVAQADISVGHLGPTQKAKMVLTNKMYHALASKVALIAGDCSASNEILTNGENCLFVKLYDKKDLKRSILILAKSKRLRQKLAENGYQLHQQQFTNKHLGKILKDVISSCIVSRNP